MDERLKIIVVGVENSNPATDEESALMAAAVGAGFSPADESSFLHTIERDEASGEMVRRSRWAILDEEVEIDGERLRFPEFRRRFESEEWKVANPRSTISRLWVATMRLHKCHTGAFRRHPAYLVRNGLLWALIPSDAPEDEARRMVAEIF